MDIVRDDDDPRWAQAFSVVPEAELLEAMAIGRERCPECDPMVPGFVMNREADRWERCGCWEKLSPDDWHNGRIVESGTGWA